MTRKCCEDQREGEEREGAGGFARSRTASGGLLVEAAHGGCLLGAILFGKRLERIGAVRDDPISARVDELTHDDRIVDRPDVHLETELMCLRDGRGRIKEEEDREVDGLEARLRGARHIVRDVREEADAVLRRALPEHRKDLEIKARHDKFGPPIIIIKERDEEIEELLAIGRIARRLGVFRDDLELDIKQPEVERLEELIKDGEAEAFAKEIRSAGVDLAQLVNRAAERAAFLICKAIERWIVRNKKVTVVGEHHVDFDGVREHQGVLNGGQRIFRVRILARAIPKPAMPVIRRRFSGAEANLIGRRLELNEEGRREGERNDHPPGAVHKAHSSNVTGVRTSACSGNADRREYPSKGAPFGERGLCAMKRALAFCSALPPTTCGMPSEK